MDQNPITPAAVQPSRAIADFAANLVWDQIPASVIARAKLLILDSLGIGVASTSYDFGKRALEGVAALGGHGPCSVLNSTMTSSPRDAAMANGMLIHGLDFDDTHMASIIHATAACLPAALAMAEALDRSGRELLVAYAAGMETAIRIGLAADGRFHHTGFHATAIAAHFSSAIVAAKLLGADAHAMVMAQGIAASTASGVQVFLEDGAWTKRFHPGWAAAAGITAATLAQHGFVGPKRPYEGKFGLFDTHFQAHGKGLETDRLSSGLGEVWELAESAIKPYPVCHFIHGAADAAVELSREINAADIAAIEVLIPQPTLHIVAEPTSVKLVPKTDYDAKFSAQFVVATCLARGHFGLAELTDDALTDPDLLALTAKATCKADPDSAFPTYFSGGVVVRLKDGRTLKRHVRINSGAGEKALDEAGVSAKFRATARMATTGERADRIRTAVLDLDAHPARDLGAALKAPS